MTARLGMNAVMDLIGQGPNSQADLKSLKEKLSARIDAILAAGKNIEEPGDITTLQSCIGKIIAVPCYIFAVAILLSAQAENLPDACAKTYIHQCKLLFSNSHPNDGGLLLAHKEVLVICQLLSNLSQRAREPKIVTRLLMQAALAMAPEPSYLTPIHPLFLQSCISGKMYTLAADFLLNNDVLEINPKETSLTPQDFLEYFYYAGLCLTGVKNYSLALDYFLQAITFPAQSLSAIVVASMKAARLVSLIYSGSPFEVPKYASHLVSRFSKQDMPHYDTIVKAFLSNNLVTLKSAILAGTDVLTEDHNLGLAKQALNALTAHNIRKLTSTYITLSLEDIKTSVGLEDIKQTELFLLKMVTSKEIVASINQKSGMVTFNSSNNQLLHTDKERIKINETALKKLEMHIKGATNISDKLRDMQQKILTSEEYLSRSSKLFQGGGVSFGKGGMSHPDLAGWGNNESMKDFIGLENN